MSDSENVWIIDDDRSIRWVMERALKQAHRFDKRTELSIQRCLASQFFNLRPLLRCQFDLEKLLAEPVKVFAQFQALF